MDIGIIVHSIIYTQDNKVLILRRSGSQSVYPEYWDIPGGTLESGELPLEALRREVGEETGLSVNNAELFFHTANIDRTKNKLFVRLIFKSPYNGENIVLDPDEHTKYIWISETDYKSYKLVDYLYNCLFIFFKK